MKRWLTVIARDNGNTRRGYEGVLVYNVTADPSDELGVLAAVIDEREEDLCEEMSPEECEEIEILFAFPGSLSTIADWR